MATVATVVYKTMVSICPDGYPKAVSTNSTVYTVEKVEMSDAPLACGENPPNYKMLLKIYDPEQGVMWIDETVESFNAKIAQALSTADKTGSREYLVGTNLSSGSVVTPLDNNGNPLINKKIHLIQLDGITIYSPVSYSYDPATGEFTFVTPLEDESKMIIVWNGL